MAMDANWRAKVRATIAQREADAADTGVPATVSASCARALLSHQETQEARIASLERTVSELQGDLVATRRRVVAANERAGKYGEQVERLSEVLGAARGMSVGRIRALVREGQHIQTQLDLLVENDRLKAESKEIQTQRNNLQRERDEALDQIARIRRVLKVG